MIPFTCRIGSLENIQIMREIALYQDRQPLAAGLFLCKKIDKKNKGDSL